MTSRIPRATVFVDRDVDAENRTRSSSATMTSGNKQPQAGGLRGALQKITGKSSTTTTTTSGATTGLAPRAALSNITNNTSAPFNDDKKKRTTAALSSTTNSLFKRTEPQPTILPQVP